MKFLEHTESCHTVVHDLVRVYLHEITVMLGQFLAFLVAYCSFQYEQYIYYVSSEKLHILPKVMLLKVDQYQLNRWAYDQCL